MKVVDTVRQAAIRVYSKRKKKQRQKEEKYIFCFCTFGKRK